MRRLFNTATVQSKISYIDGDKGILRYRGYPIEQLAEKSSFLEARACQHASLCLHASHCGCGSSNSQAIPALHAAHRHG